MIEEALRPTGTEKFFETEIMPQALTFIIAGSETMNGTLDFVPCELTTNPQMQEKIREEIKEIVRDREHII